MSDTWRAVTSSLVLDEKRGQAVSTSAAPVLSGVVESTGVEAHPELLLRLDQPGPGLVHMFVMPMGGQVMMSIRFFFYGDQGVAVAADAERDWSNWLARQFAFGG